MTLYLLAYLAGVLTIVSPCILPVIPFVLARAGQPFLRSILPMLAGLALAFAAVATLAAAGGAWAARVNEIGRWTALALLALFGATLLSTRLAEFLSRPAVAFGDRLTRSATAKTGTVAGSLSLGVATGLLWTPCAGPVLGLVLTGAALQGPNVETAFLLAAYGAGAATSLGLAIFAGRRVLPLMKQSLGLGESLRRIAGAAVLAGVAVIGLGLDTNLLSRLSKAGSDRVENTLIDSYRKPASAVPTLPKAATPAADGSGERRRSALPVEGIMPPLDGAVAWLNSPPLTTAGLKGKVVLVEFWTYSCVNCVRTLPYVRDWNSKYRDRGLVVIGVHSPEFAFEKSIENVKRAMNELGLAYPVAIDNDFRIWKAFGNQYWPAQYLIDGDGRIRRHHYGEGEYAETEQAIKDLLAEPAARRAFDTQKPVPAGPAGAPT